MGLGACAALRPVKRAYCMHSWFNPVNSLENMIYCSFISDGSFVGVLLGRAYPQIILCSL